MSEQDKRKVTDYCLALQPICDEHLRHVGDELLYRASVNAKFAVIDNPLVATARVCNIAFYEMGKDALSGSRELYFNTPREWLINPDLLPPVADSIVLEVLESVEGDAEVMAALRNIKALGYRIALDDFVLNEATSPLLELADIVKIDLLNNGINHNDLQLYKSHGIQLLAEKVEDFDTFKRCRELGFTLFQGYFYAKPEVRQSQFVKRSSNKAAQLRLLAVLNEQEPEFDKLEPLLAQDSPLCIRLLRLCNSPLYRRQCEISSLRQAMILVGFTGLRKLIIVILLADNNPCNLLLLPKALTRAAMCERLAAESNHDHPDSAFLVGILSMMDTLLDEPLDKLCLQLPLSEAVREALLRQHGHLGEILRLTIAYENARLGSASQHVVQRLNRCYLSSVNWANSLLSEVTAAK